VPSPTDRAGLVCVPLLMSAIIIAALPIESSRAMARSAAPSRVETGTWGGDHIRLDIRKDGADVEYDCARGQIEGPLELSKTGSFDRGGIFVRSGPGALRPGRSPGARAARYAGKVDGKTMTLIVTLADTSERIGTFTVRRGREGRLWKCL
jgi:hypothetical protein